MKQLKNWIAANKNGMQDICKALDITELKFMNLLVGKTEIKLKQARIISDMTGIDLTDLYESKRAKILTPLQKWAFQEHGRIGLIAEKLGVTREYASMLVNGKYEITVERSIEISKLTGMNVCDVNPVLSEVKEKLENVGIDLNLDGDVRFAKSTPSRLIKAFCS